MYPSFCPKLLNQPSSTLSSNLAKKIFFNPTKSPWNPTKSPWNIEPQNYRAPKGPPHRCRKEPPHVALLQSRGRCHAEPRAKVPRLGELHLGDWHPFAGADATSFFSTFFFGFLSFWYMWVHFYILWMGTDANWWMGNLLWMIAKSEAPVCGWFIPLIALQPSKVVQDFFHPTQWNIPKNGLQLDCKRLVQRHVPWFSSMVCCPYWAVIPAISIGILGSHHLWIPGDGHKP